MKSLLIPFVRAADAAAPERAAGGPPNPSASASAPSSRTALVDPLEPETLVERLRFSLPEDEGVGEGEKKNEGEGEKEGKGRLLALVQDVLRYSVNTWDQGFLDKLYSSTNPVRRSDPSIPLPLSSPKKTGEEKGGKQAPCSNFDPGLT